MCSLQIFVSKFHQGGLYAALGLKYCDLSFVFFISEVQLNALYKQTIVRKYGGIIHKLENSLVVMT